jgi:hypothetical protein
VLREKLAAGQAFAFCNDCGENLVLRSTAIEKPTPDQQAEVAVADARTFFESAVLRVTAYVKEQSRKTPRCFISYAWGVKEHERWVRETLAKDLKRRESASFWTGGRIARSAGVLCGSSSGSTNAIV